MPEELAYRRASCSPETRRWNRHFKILVNEYGAAVEDGDEGWIANTVDEVRKLLGNLMQNGRAVILPTQNEAIVTIPTNDPLEKNMALEPIIVEGISRETPTDSTKFLELVGLTNRQRPVSATATATTTDIFKQAGLNTVGDILDYVNEGKPLIAIQGFGLTIVRKLAEFFQCHGNKPDTYHDDLMRLHPSFTRKIAVSETVAAPQPKGATGTSQHKILSINSPGVSFQDKLALAVSGVDENNKQLAERMFLQGGVLIL